MAINANGSLQEQPRRIIERLRDRDVSLWSDDPAAMSAIAKRLGWLDLPAAAERLLPDIYGFVREVRDAKIRDIVLLGMGGSSLCPLVLSRIFPPRPGFPSLTVFDSTDPDRLLSLRDRLDVGRTLFIVASKSGTTVEPLSAYSYWHALVAGRLKDPGKQFVAITDRGTPLADIAAERGFRRLFLAPTDVGGRYSALTFFGLLPAALFGIDLQAIIKAAASAAADCATAPKTNPGWSLGEFMARMWYSGRDKLVLSYDKSLSPFGLWVEQLVAESIGKHGIGLVPIVDEPLLPPEAYGPDRAFVVSTMKDKPADVPASWREQLRQRGFPILELQWDSLSSCGYQFYLWEYATAVAGCLLGINPFDEPDVAAAKRNTMRILSETESIEKAAPSVSCRIGAVRISMTPSFANGLPTHPPAGRIAARLLSMAGARDYFAVLSYLPQSQLVKLELDHLRDLLARVTGRPVTIGHGPRYLHSTGQLHKGGGDNGIFLMFLVTPAQDVPIPALDDKLPANPGRATFAGLYQAQAFGDFAALQSRGRPVLMARARAGQIPVATLIQLLEKQ